jgi:transcriptional regulator with XRE-family HTH domain
MVKKRRKYKKPITPPRLDAKAIGLRIRRTRKSLGWALSDLARVTGLAHQTVASYECGARIPNRDNVIRLSIALRRSLEWILFGLAKRGRGVWEVAE